MTQNQSRGAASASGAAASRSSAIALLDGPKAVSAFLGRMQAQMAMALPAQLKPERMTRLVLTAFSSNPKLAECEQHTIAGAIMNACQLGLEPHVNGQCFLVPYYNNKKQVTECQLIPGWKGLVDLANRSGRCVVWTGAVYAGDEFDYALGSDPFIRHKPCGEDNPAKLLYVYAVGKIKGMEHVPVIDVWPIESVWKHRNKYNKQGERHYSFKEPEAYARKIPLLQVLKYMPQSVELTAALAVSAAAESNKRVVIDADTWVPTTTGDDDETDGFPGGDDGGQQQHQQRHHEPQGQQAQPSAGQQQASTNGKPALTDAEFRKKEASLKSALQAGESGQDLITALETRNALTTDQKMELLGWERELANPTKESKQ
jgi:recombinase, phage RecT family